MSTERLATFEDALGRLETPVSQTTAADCERVLSDLVEPPAVGAPLPYEGASLPTETETDPTAAQLEAAATGITPAAFAVADYGSVVVPSTAAGEEPASLYADRHIAVVAASDVVPDMAAAFERFGRAIREGRESENGDEDESETGPTDFVVATGPSATADMGALVYGAHGPRAVDVVVLEDR